MHNTHTDTDPFLDESNNNNNNDIGNNNSNNVRSIPYALLTVLRTLRFDAQQGISPKRHRSVRCETVEYQNYNHYFLFNYQNN